MKNHYEKHYEVVKSPIPDFAVKIMTKSSSSYVRLEDAYELARDILRVIEGPAVADLKSWKARAEAAEAKVWELAELLSGAQVDTCEKWCRGSAGVVHVRFCEAVTAALAKLAEDLDNKEY